jgi:flagellar hook-associated protein 1 FlgK
MAGSLTLALRTAQSALLVNQSALNAVANNIANVNSPGYSRKIVNTESRVIGGSGAGVQLSALIRQVDEGLLKSLRFEVSSLNALSVQTSSFERMQELFGSPADDTSISHVLGELTNALETLAVSPDKTLEQSELVRRANELALKFQMMSTTIQELRQQADQGIADAVTEINKLIISIGDLNDKLIRNSAVNLDVTDLQDQRDQALDRLAEFIDIRYFRRTDGDVVVFTSSGRTLVDNVPATLTHTGASTVSATTTHAEGDFAGLYVGTPIPGNDITNDIRSGRLKGLIDLRDDVLANLQSEIDEMAAELRDVFNQIHNRGVPFPGMQSMTGTRIFVAPTTQTMTLDPGTGAADVTIALFDGSGDQQAVTTLNTIMTSASFGTGAQASFGAWTITEVAATIEDWLQANGAAGATATVNSAGNFIIALNTPALNLAFRDETATVNGSTAADVQIGFDSGGVAGIDETVGGFSNFFGLNDFFVDGLVDNIHESNVMASTFTSTAATLRFNDSTGLLTGSPLSIAAGSSLSTIATLITNSITDVTATVVPDGSGFRLRIAHKSGASLVITQDTGAPDTLLTDLGMHSADVRVAATFALRSDIATAPAKISRGAVQWNAALGGAGKYFTSVGDNATVKALAEQMTNTNAFDTAGGLSNGNATFTAHAAAILSRNASLADTNKADLDFQQSLANSLQLKSDTIRGVNLDEELSQLIMFEQAFSAAARILSTIQKMFDALERAI